VSVASDVFGLLRRAARNFLRDSALDHSATIAFYSLISLGPLVYLGAVALGAWADRIDSVAAALGIARDLLPPEAGEVLLRAVHEFRARSGFVVAALPALLWVATSALAALEHSVNVAFGRGHRRSRWRSRLKGLALLSIGWLLLIALHLARGLIVLPMSETAGGVRDTLAGSLTRTLSELLLTGVSFVVFTLFLRILPRQRVPWRSAAAGGTVSLVLWEVTRRVFAAWLGVSPTFGLLSGTVAGLVALALWVYTSSAVLLAGAEVAAVHCGARERGPGAP